MALWLAEQTAVLTAPVRASHECRFPVQCKVIAAFYDAITGPTELIISIFNLVKMVNIPSARLPLLKEGKSLGILNQLECHKYLYDGLLENEVSEVGPVLERGGPRIGE